MEKTNVFCKNPLFTTRHVLCLHTNTHKSVAGFLKKASKRLKYLNPVRNVVRFSPFLGYAQTCSKKLNDISVAE